MGSWKQEFDRKYRRAVDSGSIDAANKVLLRAISGLDRLLKPKKKKGEKKRR